MPKKREKVILELSEEELNTLEANLCRMYKEDKKCADWDKNSDNNEDSRNIYLGMHCQREDLVKLSREILANSLFIHDSDNLKLLKEYTTGYKKYNNFTDNGMNIDRKNLYETYFTECVMYEVENYYKYENDDENKKNKRIHSYIMAFCIPHALEHARQEITGMSINTIRTLERIEEAESFLKRNGITNPTSGDISAAYVFLGYGNRRVQNYKPYNIDKAKRSKGVLINESNLFPGSDEDDSNHFDPWDMIGVYSDSAEDVYAQMTEDEAKNVVAEHLSKKYPVRVLNTLHPFLKKYLIAYLIATQKKIEKTIQLQRMASYSKEDAKNASKKSIIGYATPEETIEEYEQLNGAPVKNVREFKRNLDAAKKQFNHNWIINAEREAQNYRKNKTKEKIKLSNDFITNERDELFDESIDIALCCDARLIPEDYRISEQYDE